MCGLCEPRLGALGGAGWPFSFSWPGRAFGHLWPRSNGTIWLLRLWGTTKIVNYMACRENERSKPKRRKNLGELAAFFVWERNIQFLPWIQAYPNHLRQKTESLWCCWCFEDMKIYLQTPGTPGRFVFPIYIMCQRDVSSELGRTFAWFCL